jgi:hypothetical protein
LFNLMFALADCCCLGAEDRTRGSQLQGELSKAYHAVDGLPLGESCLPSVGRLKAYRRRLVSRDHTHTLFYPRL